MFSMLDDDELIALDDLEQKIRSRPYDKRACTAYEQTVGRLGQSDRAENFFRTLLAETGANFLYHRPTQTKVLIGSEGWLYNWSRLQDRQLANVAAYTRVELDRFQAGLM